MNQMSLTLSHPSLTIDVQWRAPVLAIVGPNGAGKSTILRALAGGHTDAAGSLRIHDTLLWHHDTHPAAPSARRVVYAPQDGTLFTHLNVLDNVAFGLHAFDKATRRTKAREYLELVACSALAARRVSTLSGGERQRVALARAMAADALVMLLDEPFGALDIVTRKHTRGVLKAHLESTKRAVIMVTHDIRDLIGLDAHLLVIDEGAQVQDGPLADVCEHPVGVFAEAFVDVKLG